MNIRDLGKFEDALSATLQKLSPQLRVYLFGHIGDGMELHVNILMPEGMGREDFLATCHENDLHLFQLIKDFASVSAEHGIGLLKKSALPYSRSG